MCFDYSESLYVIFLGDITGIGGGQIYVRNKVNFMKEKGATVLVFSGVPGEILIPDLAEFSELIIPELDFCPNYLSSKKVRTIENKICEILSTVQKNVSNVIVESNTIHMACWAEMIAERMGAKHFCFLLEECFVYDAGYRSFFEFKLRRKELAGIHDNSMEKLLGYALPQKLSEQCKLVASCINVVENVKNKKFEEIPYDKYDYVICSLGRLDKEYIPNMIEGLQDFVRANPLKKMCLVFIGDQPKTSQKNIPQMIEDAFIQETNVSCYLMGYVCPIPQSFFAHVDVGIASSGSCSVFDQQHVKVIAMDAENHMPIGVFGYTTTNVLYRESETQFTLQELLHRVLQTSYLDEFPYQQKIRSKPAVHFEKHLEFVAASEKEQIYFPVKQIKLLTKKSVLKKAIIFLFGIKCFVHLNNLRKSLSKIRGKDAKKGTNLEAS